MRDQLQDVFHWAPPAAGARKRLDYGAQSPDSNICACVYYVSLNVANLVDRLTNESTSALCIRRHKAPEPGFLHIRGCACGGCAWEGNNSMACAYYVGWQKREGGRCVDVRPGGEAVANAGSGGGRTDSKKIAAQSLWRPSRGMCVGIFQHDERNVCARVRRRG